MEAGPWRGFKDAILRVWTRRDGRGDPQQGSSSSGKDPDKDGQSSLSVETVTVGLDAATGGRALTLATVAQPSLPQTPVPGPPTLTGGQPQQPLSCQPSSSSGSSRMAAASSPRLKHRDEGIMSSATAEEGEGEDEGEAGELLGEAGVCKAQEQLDTLIRNRGYHVRDHIPRKVLEEQVMENIRRRERIARILRQETSPATPFDQAEAAIQTAPEQPLVVPPPPMPEPQPQRSAEMMNLLTKVWSGKGVGVQSRGTGEVDWTRSQFVQECVREHNKLRSLHNAPPLTVSDQLCKEAQSWANRLAHYSLLEYSSEHGRGENILTSISKNELSGSAVAKAWYETGRTFKYNVLGSADLAQAGPFSQLVWESTNAVGIGFARGGDGRTVVVARYWPPGNIGGEFSNNVKPSATEKEPSKDRGIAMSRTRQEAHFYVSIALEPPGKVKKCDKDKLINSLRFPKKKLTGESVSSETLITNAATIDSLAPSSPVRNGAARTSKLFPICCVTPAKTEERWAQPSARSYRYPLQQQQQQRQPYSEREELDVGTIGRSERADIPILTEDQVESIHYSPHHSEDFSPKQKSILRNSPRSSPRLAPSPRLGEFSKLSKGPQLSLSPRHGASPQPGASPRLGATSRLKALTGSGEHGVVIATL